MNFCRFLDFSLFFVFFFFVFVGEPLTRTHLSVQRSAGLPELRSLRRTFIKLTGQASLSGPPPPTDADSAKRMFIEYLNRELAQS